MSAPDIAVLALELSKPDDDPALVRAFGAAMSWARDTLGLAVDDDLASLKAHNHEGVYGYARDTLKLPKATFGYYSPDAGEIDGLVAAAGDIGRRWAATLRFGMASSGGMA